MGPAWDLPGTWVGPGWDLLPAWDAWDGWTDDELCGARAKSEGVHAFVRISVIKNTGSSNIISDN